MSSFIKQAVALKHIIQDKGSKELSSYAELLPSQLQQVLLQYKIPTDPVKEEILSLNHYLYVVDSSWILPLLKYYSHDEQILLLSAFDNKNQQEILAKNLSIDLENLVSLSEEIKKTLLSVLLHKVFDTKLLPLPYSYLSDDPLNSLLTLKSEGKFKKLIFFLGLYDLSFDLKKILSASIIKALDQSLSIEEKKFLREIKKNKMLVHFSDLGLIHWDMRKESLHSILLKRGINRLAKALSESSPQLIWYIHHFLDQSYSELFEQLNKSLSNLKHHRLLINELLITMQYLRKN